MGESNFGQRFLWSFLLLLFFYAVGCVVFTQLERDAELQMYAENRKLYEQMKELYSFHHCEDPAFQSLSFCKSQAAFSESLRLYFNMHGNAIVDLQQWTPLGCLFFLTHLSTTVGYGNNHPQTPMGQFATIFFGLFGIPIMGNFLAQVARLNLRTCVFVVETCFCTRINTIRRQFTVLWVMLVMFLLGGAFVYVKLEPWTYLEALYFCFVTLSTVGFGDFLPSSPVSRVFSIFYMIFGLGVCASIIAVLTGLVATGHDTMDMLLSQKIQKSCPGCCSDREESKRQADAEGAAQNRA